MNYLHLYKSFECLPIVNLRYDMIRWGSCCLNRSRWYLMQLFHSLGINWWKVTAKKPFVEKFSDFNIVFNLWNQVLQIGVFQFRSNISREDQAKLLSIEVRKAIFSVIDVRLYYSTRILLNTNIVIKNCNLKHAYLFYLADKRGGHSNVAHTTHKWVSPLNQRQPTVNPVFQIVLVDEILKLGKIGCWES